MKITSPFIFLCLTHHIHLYLFLSHHTFSISLLMINLMCLPPISQLLLMTLLFQSFLCLLLTLLHLHLIYLYLLMFHHHSLTLLHLIYLILMKFHPPITSLLHILLLEGPLDPLKYLLIYKVILSPA